MPHAAAWRILAATPRGAYDKENSSMSDQDAFDRILASLHAASLDDSQWPATSALIDDAIGSQGNTLLVGAGPPGRHPDQLRRALLPGRALARPRAGVPDRLPSHRRMRAALPATARQPDRACHRPVHQSGVTDLRRLQRRAPPAARPEQPESPPGRAGRLPHHLVPGRSRGRRRVGRPRSSPCSPACCPTSANSSGCGKPSSAPARWAAP